MATDRRSTARVAHTSDEELYPPVRRESGARNGGDARTGGKAGSDFDAPDLGGSYLGGLGFAPPTRSDTAARAKPLPLRQTLNELDDIYRELHDPGGPPAREDDRWDEHVAITPAEEAMASEPSEPPRSSPYLEERLSLAARGLSTLQSNLGSLRQNWEAVDSATEVLQRELGNAVREITFLRTATNVGSHRAPLDAAWAGPATTQADRAATIDRPAPTPFTEFTIHQYNTTIGALKSRRHRLFAWTVALAVAISAALVTVQVLAHEPMPSIWLALLPLVWMIPVPFFFLSFFGTQRVLRRNHLDLAEGP